MAKKEFCSPENYSIVIPYKDFEKMVESARKIEQIEATCKRMEERNAAMQNMYSELLQKVAELNRYL